MEEQEKKSDLLSNSRKVAEYSREELITAFQHTVAFMKSIPGMDLERLKGQLKLVKYVIDEFAAGRKSVIMEAPTGIGKSFFAFTITKIFEYLDKDNSSYILVPNKFLQEQYERDIKSFEFKTYKMLKGQANYSCHVNNKNFLERECINESISAIVSGMSTDFAKCSRTCKYVQARIAAIKAKTTIFNYNYWLSTLNYVYPNLGPKAPFKPRSLTIFDETHVLGNIVQDMFAVELSLNSILRRTGVYFTMMNEQSFGTDETIEVDKEAIGQIVDAFRMIESDIDNSRLVYDKLVQLLTALTKVANAFDRHRKNLLQKLPVGPDEKPMLQKVHKDLIAFGETSMGWVDSLSIIIDIYKELGIETIVATIEELRDERIKVVVPHGPISKKKLILQCTKEAKLCEMAVHNLSDYQVFMSATIGEIDDYAGQTGIENYGKLVVPQVFDYTKSPIYTVTPTISMSYKNKHANKPAMVQRVIDIINLHPNERGLVHTGNFELMRALDAVKHPRIRTYTNSTEKTKMLELLKSEPDAVIIGPSLVEGVDLKDDLCRFIIFMKVPYMSMADRLTKAKMNIYPNWYGWTAMSNFLQGLGRGVRNERDYCTTYLLDSSFSTFFYRNPLPDWVQSRMKEMQSTNLGVEYDAEKEFDDMWK